MVFQMNELSLFTGAGGGLLGTHLLGWKPCGYVEWNEYCQRIIAARIKDGIFPVAPIFGDVREFVQSGAAEQYRGIADVVSAGFPCQPFSSAGKQLGEDDERNMWPATLDVIRCVRPQIAWLENVTGLLANGYIWRIFSDLATLGYDAKWGVFSASGEGANHARERIFIAANASMLTVLHKPIEEKHKAQRMPNNRSAWWRDRSIYAPESELCRVDDGLAGRVESARVCGNGQVPAVVASAWELLQ
jgi:DNA (cytosine-5)-methyltransferase 1